MIIRPATIDDAPEIATILNEIVEVGGTTARQTMTTADAQAEMIRTLPDNACFYVAQDEATGAILGFQNMVPYEGQPSTVGFIATYAKIGGVQKGVGTTLFNATRRAAPALGYTEIDATIRADNSGGLAYYRKMGFQDHSVAKGVLLDDGTLVDRISKRLKLT